MLISDGYSESAGVAGAGLLAGNYYDPHPPRFTANLKELIHEGLPLILRIHPGVRYPMSDDDLFGRVDREGHVGAVVGYDHSRGKVTIADPWAGADFGGNYAGMVEEDEEEGAGTINMNSSCDYACAAVPLPITVSVGQLSENVSVVRAELSLTLPHTMRCTVSSIERLRVSLALPEGIEMVGDQRREIALLTQDAARTVEWTVRETGPVHGDLKVAAVGLAHGTEPYRFTDVIGGQAKLSVRSHQSEKAAV